MMLCFQKYVEKVGEEWGCCTILLAVLSISYLLQAKLNYLNIVSRSAERILQFSIIANELDQLG